MAARRYQDVELGDELPDLEPDVSLETVKRFAHSVGMLTARFTDHEGARKQGLPGAIVPGLMSQALFASMIHAWSPGCHIQKIDAVFRAPILVDSKPVCRAVITDLDDDSDSVHFDLTIVNEQDETRVIGTAIVDL